jgi:hypothetical protein
MVRLDLLTASLPKSPVRGQRCALGQQAVFWILASHAAYLPPAAVAGLTAGMTVGVLNAGKPSTTVGAPEGTETTVAPGKLPAAGEDPDSLMTSIPGARSSTAGLVIEFSEL